MREQLLQAGKEIYKRRGEAPPPDKYEVLAPHAQSAEDWETEGSGIMDVNTALVNQQYISLESTEAGNTSPKLRKVNMILDMSDRQCVMTKMEARKILKNNNYIKMMMIRDHHFSWYSTQVWQNYKIGTIRNQKTSKFILIPRSF